MGKRFQVTHLNKPWYSYVTPDFSPDGKMEYQLEGKAPTTVNAGEVFFVPAETIHAVKNVGTANAAELATYMSSKKGSRSSCWPSERPVR